MYGDQIGEFVCGYWGLKGQEPKMARKAYNEKKREKKQQTKEP